MKRFIEGENRFQCTLFPESLEDYIAADNPVRVIDAFVNGLDLKRLGFDRAEPSATGRPAYEPAVMLKTYVYGYLNQLTTTRVLEQETHRNMDLIWLTGRLMPDHKTIGEFRRKNRKAIGRVCADFVGICRDLKLFEQMIMAIDGSKFKAVNSRDKNFIRKSIKRRMKRLQEHIDRYLTILDEADKRAPEEHKYTAEELSEKITSMKQQMGRLQVIEEQVSIVDTSGSKAKGRYSKADFRYDSERNEYVCPAGQRLTYRFDSVEHGMKLWVYMTYQCSSCPLHAKCTSSNAKRIKRWEKEHVLEAAAADLKKRPEAMRMRKKIVEQPYGTIKHCMGATHFVMKRLPNVRAEMSLHVLAYNLRRVINLLGVPKLIAELQAA
jgi:transposase